jgi:hypothetical protein
VHFDVCANLKESHLIFRRKPDGATLFARSIGPGGMGGAEIVTDWPVIRNGDIDLVQGTSLPRIL